MIGLYRIGPNLEFVQLLNQNNTGALIYNVKDMVKAGNFLFLATWQGLYKFDGNHFTNLTSSYGLNIDTLESLHKVSETELAISTKSGLYLFNYTTHSCQLLTSYQAESPFIKLCAIYRISNGSFRVVSDTRRKLFEVNSNSINEMPLFVKGIKEDTIQNMLQFDQFDQIGDDIYFGNVSNLSHGDFNLVKLMPNGEFTFHTLDGIIPFERLSNLDESFQAYENPRSSFLNTQVLNLSFQVINDDSLGIWVKFNNGNATKSSYCVFHKDYLFYLFNNNNPFTFIDGYLDLNNIKSFSNYHFRHYYSSNRYFYLLFNVNLEFTSFGLQNGLNQKQQFSNSSNLILSGFDNDSNLRKMGKADFFDLNDANPGPIIPGLSTTDKEKLLDKYRRVWKINRSDIERFKLDFDYQIITQPGYYINESILSWPGNPEIGGTQQMAPYVDANNDGNYNPYDGDYPKITGDQMLYFIYNDQPFEPIETIKPMQLEVHCIMYAYACDSIQNLVNTLTTNQTIFTKYRVINKSSHSFSNVYWGSSIYAQNNGSRNDNRIGSRPDKNLAFTWSPNINGGENFPIYNLINLDGPDANIIDGIDNNNNGIIDEENEKCLFTGNMAFSPGSGSNYYGYPFSSQEYYRFLNSRWRNGSSLLSGFDGITGNVEAKFIFDGAPFCSGEWNDCGTVFFGLYNRKAMLSSSGPFTLLPNQEIAIEFAEYMYYNPSVNHSPTTTWIENLQHIDHIRENYYNNSFFGCDQTLSYESVLSNKLQLTCFPNPTNTSISFQLSCSMSKNYSLNLFDMSGRSVVSKNYPKNLQQDEIDLSHLTNGVYLIQIKNEDHSLTQRFIINR